LAERFSDGVIEFDEAFDAGAGVGEFVFVEFEPFEQGAGEMIIFGGCQVGLVGGDDVAGGGFEGRGNLCQCPVLYVRTHRGKPNRGLFGCFGSLVHGHFGICD